MIRALPHQQQPPLAFACPGCGERFNNARRAGDHFRDKSLAKDPKHVIDDVVRTLFSASTAPGEAQ